MWIIVIATLSGAYAEQNIELEKVLPAAEAGDAEAQHKAGLILLGQNRFDEAKKWLKKSALQGNEKAQHWYDVARYSKGSFISWLSTGSQKKWFEANENAAQAGSAYAQVTLAMLYLEGRGIDKDPAKAAKWMREGAIQGMAGAQFMLAQAYFEGNGVKQDLEEGLFWLNMAALGSEYYNKFLEGLNKNTYFEMGLREDAFERMRIKAKEMWKPYVYDAESP